MCFDKLELKRSVLLLAYIFLSRKRLIKTIRIVLILGKIRREHAGTISLFFSKSKIFLLGKVLVSTEKLLPQKNFFLNLDFV